MDPIISTRASHLIIHRLEFHLSQLGVSVGLLHEFVAFTKRYTALTRVRKGEDIRLLITKKQWDKLDYLSDLSKNAIIRQFFTGYPDEQGSFVRWDADLMEE